VRLALPLALSLVALAPAVASARPFSLQPDDKPWGRGTLMPSLALGGSFGSRGGGSLLVGAGLTYFVVNNLGLRLSLTNFTTFLPKSYETEYPGLKKSIPTNEFSITPGVMVVLYRNYRFSPYIHAGVGPVFLNHKRGVIGEWNAGPGVLIGLGRRLAINLGVSFSSRFPSEKCETAYQYQGQDVFYNPCGFRWNINVGLVFGFGVGRQRRDPDEYQPPPAYQPAEPPPSSYPPPEAPPTYAPPAEYPPPTTAPPPDATTPPPPDATTPPSPDAPAYGPPPTTGTPPAQPVPETTSPPLTTPPPAGESVPVTPP
jgi:hypothetical protein